jgi:hypothetical protein
MSLVITIFFFTSVVVDEIDAVIAVVVKVKKVEVLIVL